MASVNKGGIIRLQVVFYEYVNGPPFDPTEGDVYPELEIKFSGSTVVGPLRYLDGAGPVVRTAVGNYQYDWTVPTNFSLGSYVADWEGIIHGSSVYGQELFEVVGPAAVTAGSAATLEADQEIVFMSGVTPLYLDPESFLVYFPDASLVDIAELIYFYSLEVEELINGATPNLKALEYIQAATLCALSRVFEYSTEGDSFTLGDLKIERKGASNPRVSDLGNAKTWCEIAALLRAEVSGSLINLKAVYKGGKYLNPIPVRSLKRVD